MLEDPFGDLILTDGEGGVLRWKRDARCDDHGAILSHIRIKSTREVVAGEVLSYHRVEGRCRTSTCAWTDITE